jgi:hypothetical protein
VATYTVTTTARQDAGLAYKLAEINAQRAAAGQGALTPAQALNIIVDMMLRSYADSADEDERTTVRQAWIDATPAQRAAAKTALGL